MLFILIQVLRQQVKENRRRGTASTTSLQNFNTLPTSSNQTVKKKSWSRLISHNLLRRELKLASDEATTKIRKLEKEDVSPSYADKSMNQIDIGTITLLL